MNSMRSNFDKAFKDNTWGGDSSRSGPGSNLEQSRIIRVQVPKLLRQLGVKTMLDLPCGDFFWMNEIRAELDAILDGYIGADIVPELIQQNQQRFQTPKFQFKVLDIVHDPLPKCDLVMVRDCFLHLGCRHIAGALRNAQQAGITHLLASTYTKSRPNLYVADVSLMGRAINLCLPPFSLPNPIELINEGCTEQDGSYNDKSLGLWRLQDLDLAPLERRVQTRHFLQESKRVISRLLCAPQRMIARIARKLK